MLSHDNNMFTNTYMYPVHSSCRVLSHSRQCPKYTLHSEFECFVWTPRFPTCICTPVGGSFSWHTRICFADMTPFAYAAVDGSVKDVALTFTDTLQWENAAVYWTGLLQPGAHKVIFTFEFKARACACVCIAPFYKLRHQFFTSCNCVSEYKWPRVRWHVGTDVWVISLSMYLDVHCWRGAYKVMLVCEF